MHTLDSENLSSFLYTLDELHYQLIPTPLCQNILVMTMVWKPFLAILIKFNTVQHVYGNFHSLIAILVYLDFLYLYYAGSWEQFSR